MFSSINPHIFKGSTSLQLIKLEWIKMDSTLLEAIREYRNTGFLQEGLRVGRELLRADRKEDAFNLFDRVYLNHLEAFPPRVKYISQEFYADITERVKFQGERNTHQIVRREAQALERIAEQTTRRPRIEKCSAARQTYELDIYNRGLDSIPPELYQIPHLQELYLGWSQLTSLEGLPNFSQLRHLWLKNNNLTNLQGLPNLPQLHKLHLGNNQLTNINGILKLQNLGDLALWENPELQDLKTIQELKDRGVGVCEN